MRRILLLAVLVTGLVAGGAHAAGGKPRCAIKDPGPPVIVGAKKDAYLWAEVHNKCLDPVYEMGTYACLEEQEWMHGPVRVIQCHANVDRPVLLVPHETNVFIAAKCDYTTIPRFYRVTAYAWAVSLEQHRFKSPTMHSPEGQAKVSWHAKRFCHITKKHVEWRNK